MPSTIIDQQLVLWFNELFGGNGWGNVILIIVSLLVTIICAGIIGFEREYHGHAAGLRTHLLVAIGSALIMIVSIYGFPEIAQSDTRDPARLAAQVVSGIGFLGAGTIIQTGTDVKGLTTATTLWLAMAIGLAAGSGNFLIVGIATILAFVSLVSLRKIEKLASRRNPVIRIVVPSDRPVLKEIHLVANHYGIAIRDLESQIVEYQNQSVLRLTMRCSFVAKAQVTAFIDDLREKINPLDIKLSTEN
ncbi:MAG: MgtC/SapB family protein [Bacilli bacterium]|jgi:putative Mg2+ transporter-C (MgtC) family protein